MSNRLRLASVSFSIEGITTFEAFTQRFTRHVDFAKDWGASLIVFPEYITSALLAVNSKWSHWTEDFVAFGEKIARERDMHILGGTHLDTAEGSLQNFAYLFSPTGSSIKQAKCHPTPFEKQAKVSGGSDITYFTVEGVKVAIAICYDVEFPGFIDRLVDSDVRVLVVPSCTDDEHGYWRVRYSCHARTVEHQIYVVQAPLVGTSPVRGFEQNVGMAGIYGPCDVGFGERGVISQGHWNQDMCIIADLDMAQLDKIHAQGAVTPRLDRRDYSKIVVR